MKTPLKFKAAMPDHPNIMHATGGVVFVIHAKPIRFGPYPTVEEAQAAFQELVASNSTEEQPKGYSAQEALDHYPDPPPAKRPTLDDFPNGLLGTWWAYMGSGQPGKVILHECDNIELDFPTSTDCVELNWLFDAYTQVEAPEEAQDWAQFEPIMDMEEGPSAPVEEDLSCECSGRHNAWCMHFRHGIDG